MIKWHNKIIIVNLFILSFIIVFFLLIIVISLSLFIIMLLFCTASIPTIKQQILTFLQSQTVYQEPLEYIPQLQLHI